MVNPKCKVLQQIGNTIKGVWCDADLVQFPGGTVWAWIIVKKDAPKNYMQKDQLNTRLRDEALRLNVKMPTRYQIIRRS